MKSIFKHSGVRCKFVMTLLISLMGIKAVIAQLNSQNSAGRLSFDDQWHFNLGDVADASQVNFKDSSWRVLDLPHDWSIEGKIDAKNPTGNAGGYFPSGIGWYRKSFNVPKSWKGKQLAIYFGGVYMNATVFINGKSLGVHPYGFTAFSYDLTPYLNYGGNNVIAVKVDNSSQINCRWYSGSGIYRHVWLLVRDKVYVPEWGVFITTPQIDPQKAVVQIKTKVKNTTTSSQELSLSTTVFDQHQKKVGTLTSQIMLAANSEKEIQQQIVVRRPDLWDLETPNLYTAKIELKQDKHALQQTIQTFGIRSLKFTPERGFELNGRVVKLNGGCVHHDNGCLGAAAYDRAEQRKVELLKKAGFNAVRTSHNPPSTAFLDACDKKGLLVIDEAFDGWRTAKNTYDYALYFDKWWKKDLDAMVLRDRNHPSIIMWSIGNEIIERKEPAAVHTAQLLADEVKRADTTRPVTSAMTTWDKDWAIFDPLMAVHDVAGYNYQLQRAVSDHKRVPSRIIVQTESYPKDAYDNWKLVQSHPYIIGDFVWTAIDYLGESGIGRYYYPGEQAGEHWEHNFFPWHGAYCGDIDLMGNRKPISYYRSMLYNEGGKDKENLYLAVKEPNPPGGVIKETMWSVPPTWERWTWPGYEGKEITVEVYSRYPAVRLYLNDQLIGEQPTGVATQFKAVFKLPYRPGVLRAVGLKNGKEVEAKELKTAGKTTRIRLTPDRNKLTANGQDLSYVQIALTDEHGIIQPDGSNRLFFTVSGPGTIIGVDNGNLNDPDPYQASSRKAWKGKALVIIKSGKQAGEIKLTVRTKDLPPQTVTISSEAK